MRENFYVKRGKRYFRVSNESEIFDAPLLPGYYLVGAREKNSSKQMIVWKEITPERAGLMAALMEFQWEMEDAALGEAVPHPGYLKSRKSRAAWQHAIEGIQDELISWVTPTYRCMFEAAIKRLKERI